MSRLNTSRARVSSVLLGLSAIAVVSIQTYVYVTFRADYEEDDRWFLIYNSTAIISGTVSFLSGFFSLCCVAAGRSKSSLGFPLCVNILAAIAALASCVVASLESSRIANSSDYCTNDCSLLMGLEIGVAALSGVSFVIAFYLIIVISTGLCGPGTESDVPPPDPVVETVPEEQVEEQVAQEEPEPIPYLDQLKLLSREELERRLEQHFQTQFLEELRQELQRRNLIQDANEL